MPRRYWTAMAASTRAVPAADTRSFGPQGGTHTLRHGLAGFAVELFLCAESYVFFLFLFLCRVPKCKGARYLCGNAGPDRPGSGPAIVPVGPITSALGMHCEPVRAGFLPWSTPTPRQERNSPVGNHGPKCFSFFQGWETRRARLASCFIGFLGRSCLAFRRTWCSKITGWWC